jgi:hypothetical protein
MVQPNIFSYLWSLIPGMNQEGQDMTVEITWRLKLNKKM